MNRFRSFVLSLALGILFAAGITYATVTWHGTSWITDGAVISATNIKDNFDFVHDIFVPDYAAWSSQGTGSGGAAIYNDSGTYKKLMVVGNNSAGGSREVGIWDNLTVAGTASAYSFVYTSDRALKKDITPLTYSNRVLRLEPKTFVWKDTDKEDIGVIAQDVEQIFPEFVHKNAEGYKTVDYAKLVVPLLGVVRDQQQEIEQLKARLDAAGIH